MILSATPRYPQIDVPEELVRRMIIGHGEESASGWLDRLPELLESWCDRWHLALLPELPPLSYNLVLFGESASAGEVVLKLNLPSSEVDSEIEALAQGQGEGRVRLIDADPSAALMMLERIRPGTALRNTPMDDLESTMIGARIMKRFSRTPARLDHLHPLRRWFDSLYRYPDRYTPETSPIPMQQVEHAIAVTDRLLREPRDEVLLHGDIHHENVLWSAGSCWITIDPKGLVGEPGYEIATWMLNPPGTGRRPDLAEVLSARLDLFSRELGIDRQRLTEWAFMHSVLSMCWTLEDVGLHDLADTLRCSKVLCELLNEGVGER